MDECEKSLEEDIPADIHDKVKSVHAITSEREMTAVKERHVQKFERLQAGKASDDGIGENFVDKDKWVINLSSKQLTENEKNLLSKGMKFAITPKHVPKKEIISTVEGALTGIDKPEADIIRAKVSLTLQKAQTPKENISRDDKNAMRNLKNDNSIVILPADKGRATVILDKTDYIEKCNDHIDNGPYQCLNKDPTKSIKKKCLDKLQSLKKNNHLDQTLYNRLKPTDSPAPQFYGLPKIHKPDVPIRPIVSYTGTPLYNLSKYISNILKTYINNDDRHSKNSKVFSEYVRTLTVDDDETLVSFDVTSLYTNVPINDTLTIIKEHLDNDGDLQTKTKIPKEELLEIIRFLLTETWFKFNNNFYTQTDGVAMGGPTSSVVAEIYMQKHDNDALTTFQEPPKAYERYVDDTFCIIKRQNLQLFHEHLNSIHHSIKFTIEEEKENCLPFLDTLIKRREDGSISVSVYRKPTHTDQYLNFNSNHPTSTKEAVISALLRRANDIVSDPKDLDEEKDRITNVLTSNGYSNQSITKVKRKMERKQGTNNLDNNNVEKTEPKKYISLPYVPGTSELLRRIFSTHNIKCSFHSPTTLRRFLSKPKDQVPIEEQNNVIYKIPCGDCQAVYIGETKRSFGTRYKEHFSAVKNGNVAKYEIAEHSWKYDHRIDWDNKTIIDRERFLIARKAKETIHSLADKNHINSISYVLPDIWLPILQQQN